LLGGNIGHSPRNLPRCFLEDKTIPPRPLSYPQTDVLLPQKAGKTDRTLNSTKLNGTHLNGSKLNGPKAQ
jgi:hypothetical protein